MSETVTIATLIGYVGNIFTAAMSWAASVGTAIVGSPLLTMFCILPLVGLGVGLFKRLISC